MTLASIWLTGLLGGFAVITIAAVLLVVLGVNAAFARQTATIRDGRFELGHADIPDDDPRMEPIAEALDDAERAGFEWRGLYELHLPPVTTLIALWCRPGKYEAYTRYVFTSSSNGRTARRVSAEFCTRFNNANTLDTADSADCLIPPDAPGRFTWALPGATFDDLLAAHERARDELMRTHQLRIEPEPAVMLDAFRADTIARAEQVTRVRGWRTLGLWWFLTRKRLGGRELWRHQRPA